MKRLALVALLFLVACASLPEARQRAVSRLNELKVGESTPTDVTARFGPPQHVASAVTQAGAAQIYSYSAARMMIAASPPGEQLGVESTLGMAAGMSTWGGGPIVRPGIVRFVFVNGILRAVEQF